MDIEIYKTYRFDFNQDIYLREFKKALNEHEVTKPAQLNKLLEDMAITDIDYETVKSYFYGRRVPPLHIFIAICKCLHLCADSIAFPQSIYTPVCKVDLSTDIDFHSTNECFMNVFHPYNYYPEDDSVDLTEYLCVETYESDVDTIALLLSRYNYLIQKYHYASVSNDEFVWLSVFTEHFIIDRDKDVLSTPQEIIEWIRDRKDKEFLQAFYDKYTIGLYGSSCHSLLTILRTAIDSKLIGYAARLLPEQDKFAE